MDATQAFEKLEKMNIVKVEMRYVGGGDEGGVEDGIKLYSDGDHEDAPTWEISDYYYGTEEEFDGAQALGEALAKPIFDRHGGFNGDPYVDGTLTWDVNAKKAFMQESRQEWHEYPSEEICLHIGTEIEKGSLEIFGGKIDYEKCLKCGTRVFESRLRPVDLDQDLDQDRSEV